MPCLYLGIEILEIIGLCRKSLIFISRHNYVWYLDVFASSLPSSHSPPHPSIWKCIYVYVYLGILVIFFLKLRIHGKPNVSQIQLTVFGDLCWASRQFPIKKYLVQYCIFAKHCFLDFCHKEWETTDFQARRWKSRPDPELLASTQ